MNTVELLRKVDLDLVHTVCEGNQTVINRLVYAIDRSLNNDVEDQDVKDFVAWEFATAAEADWSEDCDLDVEDYWDFNYDWATGMLEELLALAKLRD